ncbi:MAG: hypothetical protein IJ514_01865 [Clostridia bacterium]|nr:hypothetical protein [Clostridia bacterium]
MLKEKIKEMDLRVTELADYLQLSRPTMYKFIEYYDQENFGSINKSVLKLFNFISENELVGRKAVIAYILNNLVEVKPLGENTEVSLLNRLRKYLVANPDAKKSKFIENCVLNEDFDEILCYLYEASVLLKKKSLTEADKVFLETYYKMIEAIRKQKKE